MSDADTPQHVADTLDGAMPDWSGPDAMRWSPDPSPLITFPRVELRDLPSPAPWPGLAAAREELRQWIQLSFEQYGAALQRARQVRERALWAARRRGTGPTTPAAGKARRPRRHQ